MVKEKINEKKIRAKIINTFLLNSVIYLYKNKQMKSSNMKGIYDVWNKELIQL